MKLQITPLPHELRQVVPSGFRLECRGGFAFLIDELSDNAGVLYGMPVMKCSALFSGLYRLEGLDGKDLPGKPGEQVLP